MKPKHAAATAAAGVRTPRTKLSSPEPAGEELRVTPSVCVERGSRDSIHTEAEVVTKHRIIAFPRLLHGG